MNAEYRKVWYIYAKKVWYDMPSAYFNLYLHMAHRYPNVYWVAYLSSIASFPHN